MYTSLPHLCHECSDLKGFTAPTGTPTGSIPLHSTCRKDFAKHLSLRLPRRQIRQRNAVLLAL
jgi:hypothetical protein